MSDKIFIEKLVLMGKHGVSDRERSVAQEFHIDIFAEADTTKAGVTDDISDTVNYKNFMEIAKEIMEGPSVRLVETIARKIASGILKNEKVKTVSVTVRKPQVFASGIPGVTITRTKR